MANLFPEDYDTTSPYPGSNENHDGPIGYKPGLSFDYWRGDFSRDGNRHVISSSGVESWKSWVTNCLQTERYAHLAYSTDFGIEKEKIFRAESRAEAESVLVRQVTEAILADPYGRANFVQINSIDWLHTDSIVLDITVYGIDDVTIDVKTIINAEGMVQDARV